MSENKPIRRSVKVALTGLLSLVVFFITVLAETLVAGEIIGTHLLADGSEELNGGGATTITLVVISAILTLAFAIWLYKLLSNYKVIRTKDDPIQ